MKVIAPLLNAFGLVRKDDSRKAIQAAQQRGAYEAATVNRLTFDWAISVLSPDAALRGEIKPMRERSREMERNNPYIRRYLRTLENNVLGANGMGLQMRVQDDNGSSDHKANRLIENAWAEWRTSHCSVDGRFDFRDLESHALRSAARDGGILVRFHFDKTLEPFHFAIELKEIDWLDHDFHGKLSNGNFVRFGVEFDSRRRVVAYHLHPNHPGDSCFQQGAGQRERVLASEMFMLFRPTRVEQTIGEPWIVAAMSSLKMLSGYEEAEVVAARSAACKMGFFERKLPNDYGGDGTDLDGSTITEATPGTLEQLPIGMEFKPYDPTHPSTAFPDFIKTNLRKVASGLTMSYNTLANDLEGVNFSSIRAGLLDEREEYKCIQNWLITHFHTPIFSKFLETALAVGAIRLPIVKFKKFNVPEFKPRRWPWVDPEKDVAAKVLAIKHQIASPRSVVSEDGGDYEDIIDQIAEDTALAASRGIVTQTIEARTTHAKSFSDAYGVAARAGALTPNLEDEVAFRSKFNLPEVNEAVTQSWTTDGGSRKPITFSGQVDQELQQAAAQIEAQAAAAGNNGATE